MVVASLFGKLQKLFVAGMEIYPKHYLDIDNVSHIAVIILVTKEMLFHCFEYFLVTRCGISCHKCTKENSMSSTVCVLAIFENFRSQISVGILICKNIINRAV